MWDGVTPLLAGRFRVIALDCRGHGASSEPHDTNAYGSEMVADVARLLDELTIDAAHVVGYSMGAEIALNFTTRWPERGNLERMAGVVPNFTMKVLDGVDHMGAVTDPRLATYIREFLLERVAQ